MKTLILLSTVLISTTALAQQAPAKKAKNPVAMKKVEPIQPKPVEPQGYLEYGLGISSLTLSYAGADTNWNSPLISVALRQSPTHGFDMDMGVRGEIGYNADGEKRILLGSLTGDLGARLFVSENLSLAAHVVVGITGVDYKNSQFSSHQLNALKGGLANLGGNVDVKYQATKQTSFGFRIEKNKYINLISTDSTMSSLTTSAFLSTDF